MDISWKGLLLLGNNRKDLPEVKSSRSLLPPGISFEKFLLFSIGFSVIWVISRQNYLLFHTVAEGFSIVVACLIYVLATRTYKYSGDSILLFIGNAYLAIAVIDFFHTIAYKGMGILSTDSSNHATQLWIAARYLEASALLLAPRFANRITRRFQFPAFMLAASILIFTILGTDVFPDCFVEGSGLTTFKIASEFVISGILAAAMLNIWYIREKLAPVIYRTLMLSIGATILSEMAFTLYSDVYGIMNGLGHVLKVISFIFIYQGVVIKGLEEPYEVIFKKLQEASFKDPLTGLLNRQGFMEAAGRLLSLAKREHSGIGMLMMDIDNFKSVNDKFGHVEGDSVLKQLAGIILDSSRDTDVCCRFGGDEFLVFLRADTETIYRVGKRMIDRFRGFLDGSFGRYDIDLSIGTASAVQGESLFDVERLIIAADENMYVNKKSKTGEGVGGFRWKTKRIFED